jgi:hypothetical protein
MYQMNSTDVTVSQHDLYCVIRRQEYLFFGQAKRMFIGLELAAMFNHNREHV